MEHVEIWFAKKGKVWFCGIGDCIHDGMFAKGKTKSLAAFNFIKKYNKEKIYTLQNF